MVGLVRAAVDDAKELHAMQVEAFTFYYSPIFILPEFQGKGLAQNAIDYWQYHSRT